LAIATTSAATISNLPTDMTAQEKTDVVQNSANAVLEAFNGNDGVTGTGISNSIKSAVGTGPAFGDNGVSVRRRRLARRLAGHAVDVVTTVIETIVPTDQAETLKTSIESKTGSSGTLSPNTIANAIVEKVKNAPSLQAKLGSLNLTATVTTDVSDPVIPVTPTTTTGSGSTSGTITEYLSFGAALVFGAALLM